MDGDNYTYDGEVPALSEKSAQTIYGEYEERRKKFVDTATYEHECKLHQDAIRRAEQAEADAKKLVKLAEHRNCKWQEATRCDCGLLQLFYRYELGGAK